jgi:ketosteroid isomerase-like protein
MTDPATAAVSTYFDAWRSKDFRRLRTVLADDVEFTGPLAQVSTAEEYQASMEQLGAITEDVVIEKMWVDGGDVLTWFELRTKVAPPTPVANWCHVEGGRITRVRVTFDPRGLLAG